MQFGRVAVADEHHVDVAGVVQLGTAELAHPDDSERWSVSGQQPVGLAEHVGGEGREGGDGHVERIDAEQVTGGDPELFEPLPSAQLVTSCGGDGWPLVEDSEHRQRPGIRFQQAGKRVAGAADRDERGGERWIVSEQRGGIWLGGHEPLQRMAASCRLGRSLDRLVEGGHFAQCARSAASADPQSNRQRVTFWGNPLSVQAYTVSGRNDQNGRNDGSCSWV